MKSATKSIGLLRTWLRRCSRLTLSPLQRAAARPPCWRSRLARFALEHVPPTRRDISRVFERVAGQLPDASSPRPGCAVLLLRSLASGGVQRQVVYTAIGLRRMGYTDVHVIAADLLPELGSDFFLDRLKQEGVHVHDAAWHAASATDSAPSSGADAELRRKVESLLSSEARLRPHVCRRIAGLYITLRQIQPDVVHAWGDSMNVLGGLAARMLGVPTILMSGRSLSPCYRVRNNSAHYYPIYRALITEPTVTLLNNSHAGALDYASWLGMPVSDIRVVYNALDPAELGDWSATDIAAFRERHGLPGDTIVVGGLFRHDPQKRSMLWVQAAERVLAKHAATRFVVFGAVGRLGEEVQQYIHERGLSDHIKLCPATHEVGLALRAMDIFLLTADYEGTPNALIEAQGLGIPVVATGRGGVRESMEHGKSGIYVEQPTADRMAEAVLDLINDEGKRASMSEAGKMFTKRTFALDRMLQETLQLYGWDASDATRSDESTCLV